MGNWHDIELNGIGRWMDVDLLGDDSDAGRALSLAERMDVFGDDAAPVSVPAAGSAENAAESAKRIVMQAQKKRLPPPKFEVRGEDYDGVRLVSEDSAEIFAGLLGDPDGPPSVFTSKREYPLLRKIYRKFAESQPKPKKVRVDDEESYNKFCAEKGAPYLDEMAQRVTDLEQAYAAHVSDGHGGVAAVDPASIAILAGDISRLRKQAVNGGKPVPLQLDPRLKGKVRCWEDGDQIWCSIRVCTYDGKKRILTSSTPISKHAEEVDGYIADAAVDPVEVLGAIPVLATMLGGGQLTEELIAAAPEILKRSDLMGSVPSSATIVPSGNAEKAALVCLHRLADKGDKQAKKELERVGKRAGTDRPLAEMLQESKQKLLAGKSK